MVTEIAQITIDQSDMAAFEAAVAEAAPLFRASPGCRSMSLERVIETPGRYVLRIGWDSVEAHVVDFRNSEAYRSWRGLVGDLFATAPIVEHSEKVGDYF